MYMSQVNEGFFHKKSKLEDRTSAHIMQVMDNYRSKEMLQSQANVSGYECNHGPLKRERDAALEVVPLWECFCII